MRRVGKRLAAVPFLLVLACVLLGGVPAWGREDPAPSATVDLLRDTRFRKYLVVIPAKINGIEGAFVLDTGSVSASTMSKSFAQKCGLASEEGASVQAVVSVGSFKTASIAFTVTGGLEKVGEGVDKGEIAGTAGILGCTFFEVCQVSIDYPAGKATLAPCAEEKPVGVEGKSFAVPFEYLKKTKTGDPIRGVFVRAAFETKDRGTKEVVLCIDTGCNSTMIDRETAQSLALPKTNTLNDPSAGKSYDMVQADSLRISDLRLEKVKFVVYQHSAAKPQYPSTKSQPNPNDQVPKPLGIGDLRLVGI
ncbi:MAG: hypothetical protein A2Z34_09250 [Planctomycetes bacterium RBG_16_59_8]|nr:MAG: hypothetical protein A2Z34_09250 [Planctomycetes bacterium RBG_16_59_8]